jgi:hypothetical protein
MVGLRRDRRRAGGRRAAIYAADAGEDRQRFVLEF